MTSRYPLSAKSSYRIATFGPLPSAPFAGADRVISAALTDLFDLVAAADDDAVDALVCGYDHTDTSPAVATCYRALAATTTPIVLYCQSAASLPTARELGASAVHVARESDDSLVLSDLVSAEIDRAATADTSLTRLRVAAVDADGVVVRVNRDDTADTGDTAGIDGTTETAGSETTEATGRRLWAYPWAPDETRVRAALDAAETDTTGESTDEPLRVVAADGVVDAPFLAFVVDSEPAGASGVDFDVDQLDVLTELHRTLVEATGSFDEKVEQLLEVGRSHLEMDAGLVAAVDGEEYTVEIIRSDVEPFSSAPAGMTVPLSETVCERTLSDGRTFSADNLFEEAPEMRDRLAITEFGGTRYIGTPITVEGETYGTLCFYGTETRLAGLTEHDRLLVEFMAQLVTYELEHQLQQEELRVATSELESLFSRIDDAFFALNADWEFVHINDRAEQLLSADSEDLIGDVVWDLFPEATDSTFYEEYHRAVDTQETVSFEEYFEPLGRWFEVTAYPADGGLSVYFRDITDRKKRRTELERYEQVLETVSDGVYALDENERFIYANEGLVELTGFAREKLIGSHIGIFKNEETIEAARSAVTEEVHRVRDGVGDGEVEIDLTVETATGERVPCQDHIALLPFDDQFRGSVGTIRDISEQVERERMLNGLLRMTRSLLVTETADEVAHNIVETVVEVIGFDRAVVRLYDDETGQLIPKAVSEPLREETEALDIVAVGEGVVGSAFEASESGICEPVAPASGTDAGHAPTLAVIPIGTAGTLSVGIPASETCSQQNEQLLKLLATNAEAAFDRTNRQQTLRRYESIVETVQEMLCVIDSEGRFRLVTEPLADRLGYSREALLESDALAHIADDDVAKVTQLFERLWSDGDRTEVRIETALQTAQDEIVPVRIEGVQLPQASGTGELIISVQDLSELVSAQRAAAVERERFSYLFENLPDPVDEVEFTADGSTVQTVNSAFESLFGELAVRLDDERNGDEPVALDSQRIVDTERTELTDVDTDRELKLQTSAGPKYFLYRNVPYELDGTKRGFEIYTDVTALKQREIQLQVLHRLFRHNLRNDLNVIVGFADLLASEVTTERHRDFASRVVSTATGLVKLSKTATTIEAVAGRQSLSREPVELGELLGPAVERFRSTAPNATLSFEQPERVTVAAGTYLRTAVAELIDNGIEHNTAETPTVSVHVTADAEMASITVRDNGPGIPPAEWRVVTGGSEISPLEHGSGLGLWLVRWVTEGYGGELEYEKTDDFSAVSIRLPLAADAADTETNSSA